MNRLRELAELTRIRTVLFWRQPEALFWVFVFPLVLAAVLGFAFQGADVAASRVGLLAGEGDERLAAALERIEHLELLRLEDPATAELELRNGNLDALVFPGTTPPGVRLDPVRAEAELARLRILLALNLLEGEPGVDGPTLAVDPMTEKGSRYLDFLFPGLLGMNLMGTGMWSIGFAVAELRQRKVLKRMLVTPMRRSSFLLSFLFSRLVFLVLEVVALVGFGAWVLKVPVRGGLFEFAIVCLVGAMVFAGMGLLAASRVRTIEGVSGMLNFVMMPMWLASGVFFSYERFPNAIEPALRLLPLTALNDALRGMMLDGDGLAAFPLELGVLLFWGLVPFAIALRIFRWE